MFYRKIIFISVIFAVQINLSGQWKAFIMRNGIEFDASTENILILNNFDTPLPAMQQQLYLFADSLLKNNIKGDYVSLSKDEGFLAFCNQNNIIHLGGPMLGCISPQSASVWIRTVEPASVMVKVIIDGKEVSFGPIQSSYDNNLSAVVPVEGLQPEMDYPYSVEVDGKKITGKGSYVIHTPAREKPCQTRILFGSCYHRMGLGNTKLSLAMVSRSPDALLLMGDIAVQDRDNHLGRHNLDYLMRDMFPAWQYVAANIPVFATWDDHDYFNNDQYEIPQGYTQADRENVWKIFRHSWNNPSYGFGDSLQGVFFRTRIGCADVIMLDNRYFRKQGSLLGEKQMAWLKKQLLDCKGPFIILSCGTMWSDYLSNGKDSWGVYDPQGREELFLFIEKNNIKGVLLISGDRHGTRGFAIPRNNGFQFYEFGAASLGAMSGPPVSKKEWNTQFYSFSGIYAFGEFTFIIPAETEPQVIFRLVDENKKILVEKNIKYKELIPR